MVMTGRERALALVASLAHLRRQLGITQAQLAKRMGTTQSAISEIESGTHLPHLITLLDLLEELECDLLVVPSDPIQGTAVLLDRALELNKEK